eukprot:gene4852-6800_t
MNRSQNSGIIFDAGGGPGPTKLDFATLTKEQFAMYERTLINEAPIELANREQEERQVTFYDKRVTIIVNIAREDFPEISSNIEVTFLPFAAQQAWETFMKDVAEKLQVEFIYSILDRYDKSPVIRILRLRNNGQYLVRQRETSSILEIINTGKPPVDVSWPITENIIRAKNDLILQENSLEKTENRIASLVTRPLVREKQRTVSKAIIEANKPDELIHIIVSFHKQFNDFLKSDNKKQKTNVIKHENLNDNVVNSSEKENFLILFDPFNDTPSSVIDKTISYNNKNYDGIIDIVTIHRLCLESIDRFVMKGKARGVAFHCYEFIRKTIVDFPDEVDLTTTGLKIINSLYKFLIAQREELVHTILDCIQHYAPPAPPHRVRNPFRFIKQTATINLMNGLMNNNNPTEIKADEDEKQILQRYGTFYSSTIPENTTNFGKQNNFNKISSKKNLLLVTKNNINKNIRYVDDSPSSKQSNETEIDNSNDNNSKVDKIEESNGLSPIIIPKAILANRTRVDNNIAMKALNDAYIISNDSNNNQNKINEKYDDNNSMKVTNLIQSNKSKKFILKKHDDVDSPNKTNAKGLWKGTVGETGKALSADRASPHFHSSSRGKNSDWTQSELPIIQPNNHNDNDKNIAAIPISSSTEMDMMNNLSPKQDNIINSKSNELSDSMDAPKSILPSAQVIVPSFLLNTNTLTQSRMKLKQKPVKLVLKSLPVVPCLKYRGIVGKMKETVALTQSFATLHQFINFSYGNREIAFKLGIAEEICDIALSCQSLPRILEYVIWIIDRMYIDGFGEPSTLDDKNSVLGVGDDYTMILSTSTVTHNNSDHHSHRKYSNSLHSIDIISEMSLPSIDKDKIHEEVTPRIDINIPLVTITTTKASNNKTKGVNSDSSNVNERNATLETMTNSLEHNHLNDNKSQNKNLQKENDTKPEFDLKSGNLSVVALAAEKQKRSHKDQTQFLRPNEKLVTYIGLYEYECRYVQRPDNLIIMAMAMISTHHELSEIDQQNARAWLDIWDDGSRDYQMLKRKGYNLNGI